MENPLLKTVALEDTAAHSLIDLLVAAGLNENGIPNNPALLEFTPDMDGPSGNVYIGNSDLSTTVWGKKIVAGIRADWAGLLAPCSIQDVYLMTDATVSAEVPLLIGITIIQR